MTDNLSRGMKTYQGGAGGAGYGQRDPSESAPARTAPEGAPTH
jgi:hypothetical protein